jgi:hypothetical protein
MNNINIDIGDDQYEWLYAVWQRHYEMMPWAEFVSSIIETGLYHLTKQHNNE